MTANAASTSSPSGSSASPGSLASGSARARLRGQIDLPTPVAVWVLAAHAVTLFSPVALALVAQRYAAPLGDVLAGPGWLHVAAALFVAGSAFEIAQNATDNWYYTGPYVAFSDLLFNLFIALGLGALALAAGGGSWWVAPVVVVAAAAFPVLYLTDRTPYPATGVLGILAVGLILQATGSPVVVLLLMFTTGLNLYLLALIVKTRAQSLHGAIALANGIGLLAVPVALLDAVGVVSIGWPPVIAAATVIAAAMAAAWRPLSRLQPTARRG